MACDRPHEDAANQQATDLNAKCIRVFMPVAQVPTGRLGKTHLGRVWPVIDQLRLEHVGDLGSHLKGVVIELDAHGAPSCVSRMTWLKLP